MTQKSIRFPAELADKIQAIAEAEDRAFSYVVVRAMERAFGDATGDRIPERPAPPRSPDPEVCPDCGAKPDGRGGRKHKKGCDFAAPLPPPSKRPDTDPETAHTLPKVERRAKASDAMSAALARQQALNKPKGI